MNNPQGNPEELYLDYTAILGGSFDPVHNGHLHIANEILRLTDVARVVFVPSGKHHFKQSDIHLDYPQRVALLEAVCANYERFEVWNIDTPSQSGYTSDFLRQMYLEHPGQKFCFVIGSDNLAQLPRWHDFSWLAENVEFLIIPRPEYPCPCSVLDSIRYKYLTCELSTISSTLVRQRVRAHESISGLVPPEIEPTIISLYQ